MVASSKCFSFTLSNTAENVPTLLVEVVLVGVLLPELLLRDLGVYVTGLGRVLGCQVYSLDPLDVTVGEGVLQL